MNYLSTREIQQAELDILVEFDRICQEANLRYSLEGGTLLGAVRHKGFIPWDDDIDVAMPRPDFERLKEVVPQLLASTHFKLIGFPTEDAIDPAFLKLVDKDIFVKDTFRDGLINLWIDIFPIDGLPADDAETERIYKKARRLRQLTMTSHADLSMGKTPLRKALKNIFHPFDKAFSIGNRCEASLGKLAKTYPYEGAEHVGSIAWGLCGSRGKMPQDAFSEFVEMEFEGKTFPALACWDHFLSSVYGDYMKLPPESERIVHDMMVWRKNEAAEENN